MGSVTKELALKELSERDGLSEFTRRVQKAREIIAPTKLQTWIDDIRTSVSFQHLRSIRNSQIHDGPITHCENASYQKLLDSGCERISVEATVSDLRVDLTGLDFEKIEIYFMAMTELSKEFGVGLDQMADFRYGRTRKAQKLVKSDKKPDEIRHF